MNDETSAILAANESYYKIFARSDYQAMEELWASEHDIAIIHPGWAPLHGHRAVMNSWQRILAGTGEPYIKCIDAIAYVMDDMAFVICTERLPEGDLVATNVFVQENDAWKMIHHQAGPMPKFVQGVSPDSLH